MYISDALKVFKTRAEIARQLKGLRHRSAVYQWPEDMLIPIGAAVLLARRSKGELHVNDRLYERERQKRLRRLRTNLK